MNVKLSPFLRGLLITTISSFAVMAGTIVITGIIAKSFVPAQFGEYSIARRIIAIVAPISTVMMGDAIVRCMAIAHDRIKHAALVIAGAVLGIAPGLLFAAVMCAGSSKLSSTLFSSNPNERMIWALAVMLNGYAIYSVLYALYRGADDVVKANAWLVLLSAVIPLGAYYAYPGYKNPATIIFLFGASYAVALFPLLGFVGRALASMRGRFNEVRWAFRELVKYGAPRVPSGFAMMGLFSVGPIIASYYGSLADAGFLVIGQSLFRIVESALVSFGLIALPKAAQLYSNGQEDYLKKRVNDIFMFILQAGLFVVFQLWICSDYFVLLWLGRNYESTIYLIRLMTCALLPYVVFVMMRSIIDAVDVRPINSFFVYAALIVTAGGSIASAYGGGGAVGLTMANAVGFCLLGSLATVYLGLRGYVRLRLVDIGRVVVVNAVLAGIMYVLKTALDMGSGLGVKVAIMGAAEVMCACIYAIYLLRKKVPWIETLRSRIALGSEMRVCVEKCQE